MQDDQIKATTSNFNNEKYSISLGTVQSFVVDGAVVWTGGSTQHANDTHLIVSTTSATWDSAASVIELNADQWTASELIVRSTSATWDSAAETLSTNLDHWSDSHLIVSTTSANWNQIDSIMLSASDWNGMVTSSVDWDDALSIVQSNSAAWAEKTNIDGIQMSIQDWTDSTTVVQQASSQWENTDNWNDTHTIVTNTSAQWNGGASALDMLNTDSDNWQQTYNIVTGASADWDNTFTYVSTITSAEHARLDSNGKLMSDQVPDLSITQTYVTTSRSTVIDIVQSNNIQQGDVVIATDIGTPFIAIDPSVDGFGQWNDTTNNVTGFTRLVADGMVRSVNSKIGPSLEIFPIDIDDTGSTRKWVTEDQIIKWDLTTSTITTDRTGWDEAYNWVQLEKDTNNTVYNAATFVNITGDMITGDLNITGDLSAADVELDSLDVKQHTNLTGDTNVFNLTATGVVEITGDDVTINSPTVTDHATFTDGVNIAGELIVTGDYTAQSGSITNLQQVNFNSTISSDMSPDVNNTHDIGQSDNRWDNIYANSGNFNTLNFVDLSVTSTATLTGKTIEYEFTEVVEPDPETGFMDELDEATGLITRVVNPDGGTITTTLTSLTASDPGVIVAGEPLGFYDKQIFPDIEIQGDMTVTGALSGAQAAFGALTARSFVSEYETLTIRDSDLTVINGNIIQTGGTIRVENDIAHIDDENTYIRFQEDQMTFRCHDINFIRLSEAPALDDVVLIGDVDNPVDFQVLTFDNDNSFMVDGQTGNVGIGTTTPNYQLHVARGEVKMPDGNAGGALLLPSGDTSTRVDKTGSIRWNTDLNTYEGYIDNEQGWGPIGSGVNKFTDQDRDTYLDVDALEHDNSNTAAIFTAGCSGLAVTPNQKVIFAGDIQFDRTSVYNTEAAATYGEEYAPSESQEFIFLMVNGKRRAIRLWDIPDTATFTEPLETNANEAIVPIGPFSCASGYYGQDPMGIITSESVTPPRYERVPHADDSDRDGLVDDIDPDDDDDGIPDYGDPDHPSNIGAVNTDGDEYMDPYDPDDDNDGVIDEQDVSPLLTPGETTNPLPGDYDGDHLKDEFDPDHGLSHGVWDRFQSPQWEEIDVYWEALDGQP